MIILPISIGLPDLQALVFFLDWKKRVASGYD